MVSRYSTTVDFFWDEAKDLKVERGQDFKEAYQPGELASRKLPAHFFVDGRALLNKNRTVAISFRSELQKQGSPRKCFLRRCGPAPAA